MFDGLELFDDKGQPATAISYATLQALAPLTDDPKATLGKLGITDPAVEAALVKVAEVARSKK